MSKGQQLGEMGNGKRTAIVLIAVLAVSALVAVVVVGFHGRHIRRNAAAMTSPVGGSAAVQPAPTH